MAVHEFGTAESPHGGSLIATGAEVMRPFLSSNGTSQMEGKPMGHICIFLCTAWGRQAERTQGRERSILKTKISGLCHSLLPFLTK